MLPTFVIGLREGLEAALIVSIIATFLRRNGSSLRSMWIGVGAAVVLALGVGVALQRVEHSLPQRQQEQMETVIGLVAVVFVTAMVVWMRTHARYMKRDLEAAAGDALTSGTMRALAVMAFLAVLREGFETSVFLLATFSSASSGSQAAVGAVLGIAVSLAIGYGIYRGGVRLNLARFFSFTSFFLILVAAGLVLNAARTAHEGGWLTIGQGRTLDLAWLAPTGSIRSALFSGVLGIPADPRVVEVLVWGCYLLPVLALTYWPQRWQPAPERRPVVRAVGAGLLAATALVLLVTVPVPTAHAPASAPLDGGGTASLAVDGQSATLTLTRDGATQRIALTDPTTSTGGAADTSWQVASTSGRPAKLDAATLLTYTGNRAPVGLDLARTPGPYDAAWIEKGEGTVLTRAGGIVDAHRTGRLLLTLTGGGLTSPRVVEVEDPAGSATWAVAPSYVSSTTSSILETTRVASDRALWKHWFPLGLVIAAVALVLRSVQQRRRPLTDRPAPQPALAGAAR